MSVAVDGVEEARERIEPRTVPLRGNVSGIEVVIAENIERIYKQNCQNLGLLTSTNFGSIDKIPAGDEIALAEFTVGRSDITKQVIQYGGLFPFNVADYRESLSTADYDEEAYDDFGGEDICTPYGSCGRNAKRLESINAKACARRRL